MISILMIHHFLMSLTRVRYLPTFLLTSTFTVCYVFFNVFLRGLGDLSVSQMILCISFSRTNSLLCIYNLFVWSKCNHLHSFQQITFPIQSCLSLYSFLDNLLHSLIMRFIPSDRFYSVHITLVCRVKINQSFVQFPLNHRSCPVMLILIFFLGQLVTFTYYLPHSLQTILLSAYDIGLHITNVDGCAQWITFPTQSCLSLYSFSVNFLYSLILQFTIAY